MNKHKVLQPKNYPNKTSKEFIYETQRESGGRIS